MGGTCASIRALDTLLRSYSVSTQHEQGGGRARGAQRVGIGREECRRRFATIAVADTVEFGLPRASWALEFGPNAGDVDAAMFWMGAPDWIAAAATPNAALDALLSRSNPDIPVRPE